MNISVFGLGYVGCVSVGCLSKMGHTTIGVDKNITKIGQINNGEPTIIEKDIGQIIKDQRNQGRISATSDYNSAILDSEISIVAVGTPSTANGHLYMENVYDVATDIGTALKEKSDFHTIAIRSTVLPGTCQKVAQIIEEESGKKSEQDFSVVSNPEFLREGTAVDDYFNPPLTLVGAMSEKAGLKVSELYKELPADVIMVEPKVSEIMKYVNNSFHALKISFANEVGNICKALNVDSNKVMEVLKKDKQLNISPYYLNPGFAYGGSCLPKDLLGLQIIAHDNYIQVPLIDSISKTNEIQIKRAIEVVESYNKKSVCIAGLSFKSGTDDLRNSPYVILAEYLLGKGYEVMIYDKNIHMSSVLGTNREYIEKHIPHLEKILTIDIQEAIAGAELVIVSSKDEQVVEILKDNNEKIIVDLVGVQVQIGNPDKYYGINW